MGFVDWLNKKKDVRECKKDYQISHANNLSDDELLQTCNNFDKAFRDIVDCGEGVYESDNEKMLSEMALRSSIEDKIKETPSIADMKTRCYFYAKRGSFCYDLLTLANVFNLQGVSKVISGSLAKNEDVNEM